MLTTIFYHVDNFCKDFEKILNKRLGIQKKIGRKPRLLLSEVMTIVIYFHHSRFRTFKDFYSLYLKPFLKKDFPGLVSYNRLVELMQDCIMPLFIFIHMCCLGKPTGIAFIDSTELAVCRNQRIQSNKTFKNFASRGKTSMGWFYGFKLHLVINQFGEINAFMITPGNVDDRDLSTVSKLTKNLFGKLFGDRGYISQLLFQKLFSKGLSLFTRIKRNMKNKLMTIEDKIWLSKRALIESVNERLKEGCQIEHTRHRSIIGFFCNLLSGIAAYTFLPKKPSIPSISSPLLCQN